MAFVIKAFVNRADKDPNIGLIEKIWSLRFFWC